MESGGHEPRPELLLGNTSPPHEGVSEVLFDSALLRNAECTYPSSGSVNGDSRELISFPKPCMDNLDSVLMSLREAYVSQPRDYLGSCVEFAVDVDEDWMASLCSCFEVGEEVGSVESLSFLFHIAKCIFLISNTNSLFRLVRDDVFEDMLGMLQYDPDVPVNSRTNHREFLRTKLQFRSVMEIRNEVVLEKLHASFRLSYIRDSVLPRLLDDYAFYTFNQAIQALNGHVINYFVADPSGLITSLMATAAATPNPVPVLQFAQALLVAGRGIMTDEQSQLLQAVTSENFLALIEASIGIHPTAMECMLILANVPLAITAVRRRCLSQSKNNFSSMLPFTPCLLSQLVGAIHTAPSEHLVAEAVDLLRGLLEPTPPNDSTAETFIVKFYSEGFLEDLARPMIIEGETFSVCESFRLQLILDLLAFCVVSHAHVAKAYFLRFGALLKSIRSILTGNFRYKEKHLQLAALRLVRAFLWQKEILLFRHLSAFNIPSLVLTLLYQSRPDHLLPVGGNMVYSACLEILTFVCVNNQYGIMEALCKPDSESERIVIALAAEQHCKAHAELCNYMLSAVERLRLVTTHHSVGGSNLDNNSVDDMQSRQSITSSRGRSNSPRPLIVPVPSRGPDDELAHVAAEPPKRIRFSTSSP